MIKETIMVSLDTSSNKTGLSEFVNAKYSRSKTVDYSKISCSDERLSKMVLELISDLNNIKPVILVMEECVVVRNAKVQRLLLRIQGAVYGWCITNDCEFNVIRPTEWRSEVGLQNGSKKDREHLKEESIKLVKELLGIDVEEDEAESILIGEAHIRRFTRISK